jgi:hypothetical protein
MPKKRGQRISDGGAMGRGVSNLFVELRRQMWIARA